MKLLAVDTSSDACSVALQLDDEILEDHRVSARAHTRSLVPMIRGLLLEGGVSPGDLDALVLGNGPGSFIGMRIGASVAQGLAHGAGLDIVPVSSLLAVAEEVIATADADRVVVAQDARMNQVYLGIFGRDGDGLATPLAEARIVPAELSPVAAGPFVAAGAGWDRYPGLATANAAEIESRSAVLYPRSRFLLPAGAADFAAGRRQRPDRVEPAYLRTKVAQKPA